MKFGIDPLAWTIIPRIHIGPLSISPHGIGIAVGFLLGAQLMIRRARKAGWPDENLLWNGVMVALVGAVVGARLGYVLGHFSEVTSGGDLLGVFKVWEGGISLLGGITGGLLAAVPYMRRHGMAFWPTMDLAAPGLALGIAVGRIGDLLIGDHLGKRTTFPLGWRCLGENGESPRSLEEYLAFARANPEPPSIGCYDVVVHQTAAYDMVSTALLFAVLLFMAGRAYRPGALAVVFGLWYGTMRVVTDFLRSDRRYLGLTGSQILALAVALVCYYFLVRHRGAPPRFVPSAEASTTQRNVPPA